MRYTSRATVAAVMFAIPLAIFGQVPDLSITNYQLVSSVPGVGTLAQMTFRADVATGATPWGSVTATVGTTDPFVVRVVPTQNTLTFPAVAAHSQVTSTNTFTVLADSTVPLDTTKLNWTFQTTPQGPMANAGPGQTATVGSKVVLDGSGSTNPSGIGTLTYKWAFALRPAGSGARLTSTAGVQSGFTVDLPGNYIVTLTVSNGTASSSASVAVSTNNTPPVANAGPDQFVNIGELVQLTGTGSTDIDGNPLTYRWSLISIPANSSATISDPAFVMPTFTADLPGTYVAQLVVSDSNGSSLPSTVTITTNPPTVPTAFAGPNRTVPHNTTITLDGVGVDPQGKPLLFQWTLLSKPASSTSAISNLHIPQPTLFVDRPGVWVAQLVVTNGTETSAPSTVTITTTSTPPVANAGPNQTVELGRSVLLNGSGSSDPDNDSVTYKWSFITVPAGSTATISGVNGVFPNFMPDLPGIYVVQLIVSDPYATASPSTVTITVPTPVVITLTPSPLALSASPVTMTVTLSAPAGTSGVVVNLTSSNTTAATVPATVTVLSGATTATFAVTPGSASGATTITASSPHLTSGTATVNYTQPATIILSSKPVPVGVGQQTTFPVSLSIPAPAPNGVVITLVSSDVTKVKIASATVTIPAGATAPVKQPLINGLKLGSSTITASAPGFPTNSQQANVVETISFYPNKISLPFISSVRTTWVMLSGTAPAGGLTINLSSDNPAVAKVPATITIPAGQTEVLLQVTGVSVGSTTIHGSLLPYIPDSTATVTIGQ